MSGRTCRSPSPALTPRPARQPSTPGWAVSERCGATRASRKARLATVVHMLPRSRHRTPKKESRRSPRPAAATLEERIEEIMDRVASAGDDHAGRAPALEEDLTLARGHDGRTWVDAGAWSEDPPETYLGPGPPPSA